MSGWARAFAVAGAYCAVASFAYAADGYGVVRADLATAGKHDPTIGVQAQGFGVAAGGGVRVGQRLGLEAEGTLGPGASGLRAWAVAGGRYWFADPRSGRPVSSLRVAYGVGGVGEPELSGVGVVSLGLDLPMQGLLGLRVEGGLLLHGVRPAASFAGVGLSFGALRPTVAVVDAAVPEKDVTKLIDAAVAPDEAQDWMNDLSVEPSDAQVWLPHPICRWVAVGELPAWRDRIEPGMRLELRRSGYIPEALPPEHEHLVLERAPAQGALVIGAWPGDIVEVDGVRVVSAADGVANLRVSEGEHSVSVRGAGRERAEQIAVVDGNGLWVGVPRPEPIPIAFKVGSSVLAPSSIQALTAAAALRGDVRWRVIGSASSEGPVEINVRLATERAEGVRAALLAAGVPEASLGAVEWLNLPASYDLAEQRAAWLVVDGESFP